MLTSQEIRAIKDTLSTGDEKLPFIFQALSDPGRLRIFKLLIHHEDICVTDVAHIFSISLSSASQQLKILEIAGLAARQRMGQMICYRVKNDDPFVQSLIRILS